MLTNPSRLVDVFAAAGSDSNNPSPANASVHIGPESRKRVRSTFSVSRNGGVTPAFAASSARTPGANGGPAARSTPDLPSDISLEPSARYQLTRSISGNFATKRSTPSTASGSSW